jgi:hypothetical protein
MVYDSNIFVVIGVLLYEITLKEAAIMNKEKNLKDSKKLEPSKKSKQKSNKPSPADKELSEKELDDVAGGAYIRKR